MYNTSKAAIEVLVGSLLVGTNLNYVSHRGCVRRSIADGRKKQEFSETVALTRGKKLAYRAGLNCLRRATENGAWLTDISHCLNGTELSREEFQDNILLRYDIVPFNLRTDCDGCGKKVLVPHDLSFTKGVLVLARHNDAAKEWAPFWNRT